MFICLYSMAFSLTRSVNVENLSSKQPPRGRQVKREGENIGLPTSASKRSKRNPLSGIQNFFPSRPTIRLKKSVVQSAAEKARQKPVGPIAPKLDAREDQENMNPNSQIPVPSREKRTVFSNPFTKKKQPPVPQEGARPLVKVRVPPAGDENKNPVTQPKGEFYE